MPDGTRITFSTCNLYNLNRPGLRIYRDADGWSQEEYEKKIDWTKSIVSTLSSDVWGFQELWHKQALLDVFDEAGLTADYKLLVPDDHEGGKIVCAGAVRTSILESEPEWIKDFPEKFILKSGGDDEQTAKISVSINSFSRPVLHFKIRPLADEEPIWVYVAHLKSKNPTNVSGEDWYEPDGEYYSKHQTAIGSAISTIRRTAEAMALRMILTDKMKGNNNPVVVMGDLNDAQHSNTLNILTGQPNYLLSGLSHGGSDTALYTVGTLQEYRSLRDVYYTHIYKNTMESLDHILISEEFYDNSYDRIWAFEGMELVNDHLNVDNHKESGTTDHGVVKVTFKHNPYH